MLKEISGVDLISNSAVDVVMHENTLYFIKGTLNLYNSGVFLLLAERATDQPPYLQISIENLFLVPNQPEE